MHWVVDDYNVIRRIPERADRETWEGLAASRVLELWLVERPRPGQHARGNQETTRRPRAPSTAPGPGDAGAAGTGGHVRGARGGSP